MKNKRHASKKNSEEQFQIRYIDLVRLIDGGDLKRFEQLAAKVNLNSLQLGNKPFVYIAIKKDEKNLINFLLELEIDLITKHSIAIDETDEENPVTELFTPIEYAKFLNRNEILQLFHQKMNGPSLEQRWVELIKTGDEEKIDLFRKKIKNNPQMPDLLHLGLLTAIEQGSFTLIDYFIGNQNVDLNYIHVMRGIKTTPLLFAIENNKIEIAKYLIFRKSDINMEGEFGNSLVTAVHFESSNDLITLILQKGASLASRHKQWPELNLREYCVQLNKVQAKAAIDNFVFRLIANGEYEKLKQLTENGYTNLNITNQFRKTGRDLAIERSHLNIVKLIDKIEEKNRKIKTKMNY